MESLVLSAHFLLPCVDGHFFYSLPLFRVRFLKVNESAAFYALSPEQF